MALVCKICGYKQHNEECIESFKEKFPNLEEHDIPYYCGACQDNATDEEYEKMYSEMNPEQK